MNPQWQFLHVKMRHVAMLLVYVLVVLVCGEDPLPGGEDRDDGVEISLSPTWHLRFSEGEPVVIDCGVAATGNGSLSAEQYTVAWRRSLDATDGANNTNIPAQDEAAQPQRVYTVRSDNVLTLHIDRALIRDTDQYLCTVSYHLPLTAPTSPPETPEPTPEPTPETQEGGEAGEEGQASSEDIEQQSSDGGSNEQGGGDASEGEGAGGGEGAIRGGGATVKTRVLYKGIRLEILEADVLCTFEAEPKNESQVESHCGWSVSKGSGLQYRRRSGRDEVARGRKKGPRFDHTYLSTRSNGHFLEVESSKQSAVGSEASLRSPHYESHEASSKCLRLWYTHSTKQNTSAINLLIYPTPTQQDHEAGSPGVPPQANHVDISIETSRLSDDWTMAQVDIPPQNMKYQLTLNIRVDDGIIAIDDLQILDEKCDSAPNAANTTASGGALVRLSGGASDAEGQVEVLHEGRWGTICSDNFGLKDGTVVCRMLGYNRASKKHRNKTFEGARANLTRWLPGLHCQSTELNIATCLDVDQEWGDVTCNHTQSAGVECTNDELIAEDDLSALITDAPSELSPPIASENIQPTNTSGSTSANPSTQPPATVPPSNTEANITANLTDSNPQTPPITNKSPTSPAPPPTPSNTTLSPTSSTPSSITLKPTQEPPPTPIDNSGDDATTTTRSNKSPGSSNHVEPPAGDNTAAEDGAIHRDGAEGGTDGSDEPYDELSASDATNQVNAQSATNTGGEFVKSESHAGAVVGLLLGLIALCAIIVIVYYRHKRYSRHSKYITFNNPKYRRDQLPGNDTISMDSPLTYSSGHSILA